MRRKGSLVLVVVIAVVEDIGNDKVIAISFTQCFKDTGEHGDRWLEFNATFNTI